MKWKGNILFRLLITFLLIILPLYFFAILFYNWGRDTVRNELLSSMDSQVAFYMNDLESNINRISKLEFDFINDDDLNKLANTSMSMSNIDEIHAILRLQQHLNTLRTSSEYIQDVTIYIPSINRTLSALGGTRQIIDEINPEEFNSLMQMPIKINSQIIDSNGHLYMVVVYPSVDIKGKSIPAFIIQIELSKEELNKTLSSLIEYNDNEYILASLLKKTILARSSDEKSAETIWSSIETQVIKQNKEFGLLQVNGKKYLYTFVSSNVLDMTLIKYLPESQVVKSIQKYQVWFWLFTALALIIIILYSFLTYGIIYKPLLKLMKAFREIEGGNLKVAIEHKHNDEFKYLYWRFNDMAIKLNTLIEQEYKHKIRSQRAELKQLQSQINPHFLYNSFFILNSMSRTGDYDNLERFTVQLGDYFSFITRSAADEVPLFSEVNHARVYADIQAMRFSNRIKVRFDELPDEYGQILVPRLIIQPLIENAFEHSLEKKDENGLLIISFNKTELAIKIIVEDNGDNLSDMELDSLTDMVSSSDDQMETTGIINIHRRLQIKFGLESGLEFTRGSLGGLKVIIKIVISEEC